MKFIIPFILKAPVYCYKSKIDGDTRSYPIIFKDMLKVYRQYGIVASRYISYKLGVLSEEERNEVILAFSAQEQFMKKYDENWRFLAKYSNIEWQKSRSKRKQRKVAYIKHYNMGNHCKVQYGVKFIAEHFHIGRMFIGDYVVFARDVDIDVTGDIVIEDGVRLSEGVKILTHDHDLGDVQVDPQTHGLINTPLTIRDHVGIGAHAIIMPGVTEIGRGAIISASALVKKQVPPYAIVTGNPGKIVGFRFPPAIIAEYEEKHYPENERISIEVLEDNYTKFFLSRISEIKSYLI